MPSGTRSGGGGRGGVSTNGNSSGRGLEYSDSVLHACGGNPDVALQVLKMLDDALEKGVMDASRDRCVDFLCALEDADGERDGHDRGSYRFLKAVTVLLRLKGFNSRHKMMPITEIVLNRHPMLAFTPPTRAAGAPACKPEPTIRALELAVHLARSSTNLVAMHLGECELSSDGGDKCITEVARLVRQIGIGSQARFLEQVDLEGNFMDADAVRKVVEAAVKERCERPRACAGSPPLWLNFKNNRVRNPSSVFQNLQAWAGWAHGLENALCLADKEGCSPKACSANCRLHLPGFLEQCKPELPPLMKPNEPTVAPAPAAMAAAGIAGQPQGQAALPPLSRPSPVRKRPPEAWRACASPATRRRLPARTTVATRRSRPRRRNSRSRHRHRSRRRHHGSGRRGSQSKPRAEVQLRPGPGRHKCHRSRSCRRRGHDRRFASSEASEALVSAPSGQDVDADSANSSGTKAEGSSGQAMLRQGSDAPYSMASGSSVVSAEEGSLDASAIAEQSDDLDDIGTSSIESECSSESSCASQENGDAASSCGMAPTAEQLGSRMNRLLESLRSSAVGGGSTEAEFSQHSLGRRTQRHLRAQRR